MSDDAKKPDPVEDLKKGFGLLFRAAKTAVEQLPTKDLEKVVVSGVKEVGRAIENVTDQIDRQVFKGKGTIPHPEDAPKPGETPAPEGEAAPPAEASAEATKDAAGEPAKDAKDAATGAAKDAAGEPPKDEEPKGPRVA